MNGIAMTAVQAATVGRLLVTLSAWLDELDVPRMTLDLWTEGGSVWIGSSGAPLYCAVHTEVRRDGSVADASEQAVPGDVSPDEARAFAREFFAEADA